MNIVKQSIQDILCILFNDITGILFIHANPQPDIEVPIDDPIPDTPRPQGLYGSVNIINIVSQGEADGREKENVGQDVEITTRGHRLLQISINTYRVGAFDLINRLYNALQRNSTIEYLLAATLGYSRRSDIRDVTIPSGGRLEERYQFDLFLFAVATDEEIVLAIESLTLTTIGDNGTQQFTYDTEVDNQ